MEQQKMALGTATRLCVVQESDHRVAVKATKGMCNWQLVPVPAILH